MAGTYAETAARGHGQYQAFVSHKPLEYNRFSHLRITIIRIGKPPALPGRLPKFDVYGGRGFHREKARTSVVWAHIRSNLWW